MANRFINITSNEVKPPRCLMYNEFTPEIQAQIIDAHLQLTPCGVSEDDLLDYELDQLRHLRKVAAKKGDHNAANSIGRMIEEVQALRAWL